MNILHLTPAQLLKPLQNYQVAPVGFLLLEKLSVHHLGTSETALRLLPLLCGVASLFLFLGVARRFLPAATIPVAVGLFAICDPFGLLRVGGKAILERCSRRLGALSGHGIALRYQPEALTRHILNGGRGRRCLVFLSSRVRTRGHRASGVLGRTTEAHTVFYDSALRYSYLLGRQFLALLRRLLSGIREY